MVYIYMYIYTIYIYIYTVYIYALCEKRVVQLETIQLRNKHFWGPRVLPCRGVIFRSLKFHKSEGHYKSREVHDKFYYQVEEFIKKAKKWFRYRRTIGNGMKILEIFGENRKKFVEK